MDKIIKKIYSNINYNTSELISDINLGLILTTFGTGFFSLGANLNNAASLMMLSILNMIYYIYSEEERLSLHTKDIIEIRKLVLDLNKKSNITILISSHYLDELSKIATKYGFIDKGHIVEEISYEELNSKIREKTIVKIKDTDKLAEYLDDNNINYEKTGKEEITIYNKINIPKFITELNNNKIEIEDIKKEKDTLENYFLKLLGGENE